ncbi:hypothetical protein QQS21_002012 [Conoideocrella luteorostrata]|uniref:Gfo/Idh/MocA-like oxidoreductase C-terminal domain-containing protein n=1 Tax=Conoideocrella luteorostrata TaxID=1105319 RepID=A0AAJ0CW25_9HYPO|nr:hypothetical protein QQS21_002012 [Conoideocrella luteorostrata]
MREADGNISPGLSDKYVSLGGAKNPETIFLTGYVLRYSPHNMLLRRLLLEDRATVEVILVGHTEPVGWFHFSHSYVRRNWRKESVAAPSLLCKSCHNIDFILWLLCYRTDCGEPTHMPSLVTSAGNLSLFTKATIESKQWYARCVWESDNDFLDDQIVTLPWDDDSRAVGGEEFPDRGPKTAIFHMAAFTEAQSKRRGKISGTHGEIQYDSNEIRVYILDNFCEPEAVKVFTPPKAAGGHGGGDGGLMNSFSQAVEAVINGKLSVEQAQAKYVGCTLKEAFMSHAMVFAAEEAQLGRKIVDWQDWWARLEERLLAQ